ncbi:MAG: DUF4861 family protein [Bacteroidota bacterium]
MNRIPLWIALLSFGLGCQSPPTPASEEASSATAIPRAQALILQQPFAYDDTDKNRVDGPYTPQQSLTIPPNLAPQNKWIMFEGPVLENDRIAYRFYADTRHRYDIYAKSVEDLVMDTVSWNYHDIMNWGSDVLKVGNSLGIGSPAIWCQDSLYTFSVSGKKEISILSSGPDTATLRTTFTDLIIGTDTLDLQQDWSLIAGQYASHIHLKVTQGSLPEGATFATGIVAHMPEAYLDSTEKQLCLFTWGDQSFHGDLLGMGVMADRSWGPVPVADELSHAWAFSEATTEVSYAFLAAWEKGMEPMTSLEAFRTLLLTEAKK